MKELKGFIVSYRKKFLLLKKRRLTDEEFVLRDYCIHVADWDETHIGKFGTFRETNKRLAEGLGCSESKVSRLKNSLVAKGELIKRSDDRMEIPSYWKYLPKNAYKLTKKREGLSNKFSKMKGEYAELQEPYAEMQGLTGGIISGSGIETQTNSVKKRGELAEMQGVNSPKSDLSSFKGKFSWEDVRGRRVHEYIVGTPEEMQVSVLRKKSLRAKQMVVSGFAPDSLYEPCFCKSGREFIDCCGPVMWKVLEGVTV